jgi:hypothetical protein
MSNPSSSAQQQTAQTVANALSGEKTFQTVSFATTGQPQVDCLAGLFAVLGTYPLGHATAYELLQMLANQYKRLAEAEADWQRKLNSGSAALAQQGAWRTDPPPSNIDPSYPSGICGSSPPSALHKPSLAESLASSLGLRGLSDEEKALYPHR